MPSALMSVTDVASQSGFSTKTVLRALGAGELVGSKVRSRWVVWPEDFRRGSMGVVGRLGRRWTPQVERRGRWVRLNGSAESSAQRERQARQTKREVCGSLAAEWPAPFACVHEQA
jgi:hypothetical protein